MSARDRILAKLKAGLVAESNTEKVSDLASEFASNPASTAKNLPDVAGWYATHRRVENAAEKSARFRQCIELAHAEVQAVTQANWLQKLWEVLAVREIKRLLVAPGTPHGQRAFDELTPSGIECKIYDLAIEAWKEEMFHYIPASLTAARAAIAETGTLILWPDADEPRLMSLVPPLHIVLLDSTKIYNTFYEAAQQENWAGGLPTNALLISGPSKTADIQQTLAYGAHGPKELVVLLIGDEQ
jgi:L-lactate dehydrogenase complex protein LldG